MSHVVLKMTRHTLINKHTDSTHTNRKLQKFKNSKMNEKDFNESGINYRYARLVCRIHIARLVSP